MKLSIEALWFFSPILCYPSIHSTAPLILPLPLPCYPDQSLTSSIVQILESFSLNHHLIGIGLEWLYCGGLSVGVGGSDGCYSPSALILCVYQGNWKMNATWKIHSTGIFFLYSQILLIVFLFILGDMLFLHVLSQCLYIMCSHSSIVTFAIVYSWEITRRNNVIPFCMRRQS